MKWFLLSFLIFMPVFSETNDNKFHVCFFELDNTVTSQNFKNRIKSSTETQTSACKKKQEFSSKNTVVHCYQPQGDSGSKDFERMIQEVTQAGDRCDGLVVSGHHTGNWYGKKGSLALKKMEDLSCKPKYRDWFSNVKALWLDGCNTVTDNIITSDISGSPTDRLLPTPDSETARVVGKEHSADKIKRKHIANTSQAYTASLDKNTPLSSRYLRMFPHTQIYGFNGAAPEGDKKRSESFIITHLSLIGKALQAEEDQSERAKQTDPIKRALAAILSFDPCDEEKREAWEQASWDNLESEAVEQQDYTTVYQLGCSLTLAKQILENPHSEENQRALAKHIKNLMNREGAQSKQGLLNLANEILSSPNSEKAVQLAKELLLNTLDEITEQDGPVKEEDKTYTHLLFNNIYDTWKTAQKYKTEDNNFYKSVQTKLQADNFKISLKERIESKQTASLRKGDYIKFYMEVNNLTVSRLPPCIKGSRQPPPCIREEIQNLVRSAGTVFKGLRSPRAGEIPIASRRALAVSVVDQLFQYDLLTKEQISAFLANKTLFPENNENPFITEAQVNLSLSNEAHGKMFMTALKAGKIPKLIRGAVLNSLSHKYLQNPSKYLENLQDLADSMDLDDTLEVHAFFNVIHTQFNHYTQEQKEDFIVEYSKKSNENLEELLLWYVGTNFESSRRKEVCGRLRSSSVQNRTLNHYVCRTD